MAQTNVLAAVGGIPVVVPHFFGWLHAHRPRFWKMRTILPATGWFLGRRGLIVRCSQASGLHVPNHVLSRLLFEVVPEDQTFCKPFDIHSAIVLAIAKIQHCLGRSCSWFCSGRQSSPASLEELVSERWGESKETFSTVTVPKPRLWLREPDAALARFRQSTSEVLATVF